MERYRRGGGATTVALSCHPVRMMVLQFLPTHPFGSYGITCYVAPQSSFPLSTWVNINMSTRKLTKLPEEIKGRFMRFAGPLGR